MAFWKIIFGLLLRRAVGPPLVALSVAVGTLVFFLVPATYSSSAFMVLTTSAKGWTLSQDPTKPNGLSNPLLQFNDGLKTTATILIQSVGAPDVLAELGVKEDGAAEVTVDDGRTNPDILDISGPYIYVHVTSPSAAEARTIVGKVQKRVNDELMKWQKELGAPPVTYITVADVVPPSAPEASYSDKVQLAGVATVLSFVGTFSIVYARTRRRALAARRPLPEPVLWEPEAAGEAAAGEPERRELLRIGREPGSPGKQEQPESRPAPREPARKVPVGEEQPRETAEQKTTARPEPVRHEAARQEKPQQPRESPKEDPKKEDPKEESPVVVVLDDDDTQVFMAVKSYEIPRNRPPGNGDEPAHAGKEGKNWQG
ncbi:hypothetical protein [Planobispora longispora]|uniref:Capsular polysaccharide biosynthesis protein n=1 Tax=Planobispora longispora TaxID=28887 RepID=A0A8J3RJR2_9ACTN|nr:hypothetical protein [Planobispora longispora]GIH76214.1 hypothetical protein Plo01_26430 [Planobispora longispora]